MERFDDVGVVAADDALIDNLGRVPLRNDQVLEKLLVAWRDVILSVPIWSPWEFEDFITQRTGQGDDDTGRHEQ